MTEIVLKVPGQPTGKGRPRFSPKSGRAYTPKKTMAAESRVFQAWQLAGEQTLPEGPVTINVTVVLQRPANHWRVSGSLSAAGERKPWPTKTPDADNILKLVMDALNGCAYRDDAQVVHAWVLKRWCNPGEKEHTLVRLTPTPMPIGVRSAA